MATKATLSVADFARKIQHLVQKGPLCEEEEMELRFYFEVVQKIAEIDVQNLVPLVGAYPMENAQKWAMSLGMHVVEGGSGTTWLSWTKGVSD